MDGEWIVVAIIVVIIVLYAMDRVRERDENKWRDQPILPPAQRGGSHRPESGSSEVRAPSPSNDQRLRTRLIAIVDTETTGIEEHDEPISVAALLMEVDDDGVLIREVDSYHGFRSPVVPISPGAFAVHGLSSSDLVGKQIDLARLSRILSSADLLVAHNAKFDRRMIAKLVPSVVDAEWACTLYGFSFKRALGASRSLDALCAAHGISRPDRHDAMADCRSLAALLFQHSGKTPRSRNYMRLLLRDPWAPPVPNRPDDADRAAPSNS